MSSLKIKKLKNEVSKMEAVYSKPSTSDKTKAILKKAIDKAKEDIAKLEGKSAPKATPKSEPKAAPKKASAAPKATKKAKKSLSALDKLKMKVKGKKYSAYSKSSTDLKRDADRAAKPIGKRKSASGNTYYEYRANRFDVKQPPKRYPKLEKGGMMAKGGMVDYSKNGYVKAIRDVDGKLLKEVKIGDDIYKYNSVYKTYNSIKNNELLHRSKYAEGGMMANGGKVYDYPLHPPSIKYLEEDDVWAVIWYEGDEKNEMYFDSEDAAEEFYHVPYKMYEEAISDNKYDDEEEEDEYADGGYMANGGNVSKSYEKIEGTDYELKIQVYYDKGGMNYFTSRPEARGYYLSVSPVQVDRRENNIIVESYAAFSGIRALILPVQRQSPKSEKQAEELAQKMITELKEQVTTNLKRKLGMMKEGGMMAEGGKIKEIEFDGTNWYLTYIDSTHFFLSNSKDFKGNAYHIGQFRNRPFYEEIKDWLKRTSKDDSHSGMMAKGGETEKPISYYKYETPKVTIYWKGKLQPLGMFKSAEEAYEVIKKLSDRYGDIKDYEIHTPDKRIKLADGGMMAKGGEMTAWKLPISYTKDKQVVYGEPIILKKGSEKELIKWLDKEKYEKNNKEIFDGRSGVVMFPSDVSLEKVKKYHRYAYADGGMMADEGVDLFEDYENIPEDVQEILDEHMEELDGGDYRDLEKVKEKLEAIGYTYEYGLDGVAYDLRKIGQKGKSETEDDEYASGGYMAKGGALDSVIDNIVSNALKQIDKAENSAEDFEYLLNGVIRKLQGFSKKADGGMMAKGGALDSVIDSIVSNALKQIDKAENSAEDFEYLLNGVIRKLQGFSKKADGGMMAKGGYNYGRSWHLDRARHNNSEDWEVRRRGSFFEKGGATKEPYTYIPNRNVEELMVILNGQSVNLKGSDILDGVYAKNSALAKLKAKKAAKVKVSSTSSKLSVDEAYKKLLEKAKDMGETDLESLRKNDVKKLVNAGFEMKDLEVVYFGVRSLIPKIDISYGSGLLKYRVEYLDRNVNRYVNSMKKNQFEIGLKYPDFSWNKIIDKYKISKDPVLVEGETKDFSSSKENYVYAIYKGNKVVLGTSVDRNVYKDGVKQPSDPYYKTEPITNGKFEGGYWGIVTSSKEIMYDIASMIISQKSGYVKDMELFKNGLGGVSTDDLTRNDVEFARGGYNYGRSWHLDRARHNNSEDWEVRRRGSYEEGGQIDIDSFAEGGELAKTYLVTFDSQTDEYQPTTFKATSMFELIKMIRTSVPEDVEILSIEEMTPYDNMEYGGVSGY